MGCKTFFVLCSFHLLVPQQISKVISKVYRAVGFYPWTMYMQGFILYSLVLVLMHLEIEDLVGRVVFQFLLGGFIHKNVKKSKMTLT